MYTMYEYQKQALRTANTSLSPSDRILCDSLGLAGEAGEFANKVKKMMFHGHTDMDIDVLMTELGDCLWYMTDIMSTWGISLDDVVHQNLVKLQKRYPDGFTQEASINREKGE